MGGVRAWLGAATAGVLVAQLAPDASGPWVAATGIGAGLCGVAATLARRWTHGRGGAAGRVAQAAVAALWCAAAVLAGAAIGRGRLESATGPALPGGHVARLALPRRARLVGTVRGLPARRPGGSVVVLEAERLDGERVEGRVRVSVRGEVPKLRPGDQLAVDTTLRRPRGVANPGSFDVAGHFARRGILVTASAWDPRAVVRRSRPARTVGTRLARWRHRLVRAIGRAAPGAAGAVLAALVVGDQGGVPPGLREAFARTGVVHVLSVSGLHVSVVGTAAFVVLRWALARSTWLVGRLDLRTLAAAGSLVPVAGYTALAGFEIATLRAASMAAAAVAALALGRRADVLRTLAAAAMALALAWPGTPREIAFQLSFASVLAIALGVRRLAPDPPRGWRARLRLAAVVSLAAAVGTAPLAARHFQQVSLVAPLANPLVIPLFGAVVVVLGLAAAAIEPLVPGIAAAGFALAAWLLRPGIAVVERLAAPSWAAVRVPTPDLVEQGLLAILLGAPVLLRGRALRLVAGAAVAGLALDAAWWVHVRTAPDRLRVTFLDVGQGDAAVAELPGGGVLVVDAGGFPGGGFDTGAAVVAPFLASRKIMRIDAAAMTHAQPDHFAGLAALLPWAGELWWTGHAGRGAEWARLRAAIASAGAGERLLHAGLPVPAFARGVAVLHPPAGWATPAANEASLVLALRLGAVAVLLTGDAEAGAEASLVGRGAGLGAAVLKVPHHGSRTSSTADFLEAVAPTVAVISVGADNRYRLPSPEVEARYRAHGTCVLRTDRCGAVAVETDGTALAVTSHLGCRCP